MEENVMGTTAGRAIGKRLKGTADAVVSTAETVTLPLPPSVNALWINVPGRGRVRSAGYSGWRRTAGWELQIQRPKMVLGRVTVDIRAGKAARRRDLDNILKPLLDLLVSHEVIDDDSCVIGVSLKWDDGIASGQVVVKITKA